jgi:hypothetical protein
MPAKIQGNANKQMFLEHNKLTKREIFIVTTMTAVFCWNVT